MKKRASVVAIKTVTSRPVLLLWASVSLSVALLCSWSYTQPAWTLRSSSEIGSLDVVSSPSAAEEGASLVRRRVERSVSIQLPPDEMILTSSSSSNNSSTVLPGRSAIPLVQIGLFGMCIYTTREARPSKTCVTHAELDYEWLPPAWQVTRVLCGGGCLLLLACAASSLAVGFVRQHQRQQRIIKITSIAQLSAASLMLLGLLFYPFGLRAENLDHFCDERCQPGWASLVAGMSSAAAFLCPVLATLVSNPIYDVNPWEAYLLL